MATGMTPTFATAIANANQIKDHVILAQSNAIAKAEQAQTDVSARIGDIVAAAASMRSVFDAAPPKPPQFVPSEPPVIEFKREVPTLPPAAISMPEVYSGGTTPNVSVGSAPRFDPSVTSLNIPDAPEERALPTLPDAPESAPVDMPSRPVLDRPSMPDLVDIRIPEFTFAPLAPFNESAPEWHGSSVSAMMQWAEVEYTPVLMDEEIAVIQRMWAGGTGLPPAVEQAMWERAASREDLGVARDVSAAMSDFSARGYTLPPGALVDRIDTIRSDAALRKQGLSREIAIKVADVHVENMRFACTQALAAENVLIGIWGQMAQRQFEMAKVNMEGELALLNANIAIYNAQQSGWKTAADIHRIALEERAQDLQQMRMQLDGEIAKGTINEQRVRVFSELYKALQADVDLYRAEVEGAKVEVDVRRNEIEKYKVQIQAVAEIASLDKLRFEGYSARIQGESAKAQMLQAQASAFGAQMSGYATEASVAFKAADVGIASAEQGVKAYMALLEHRKSTYQYAETVARVNSEDTRSAATVLTAQLQAEVAANESDTRRWESNIRSETSIYEAEIRIHIAKLEQELRLAGLQLEATKAAAQAQSTLAAGAMAGITLASSVSGGSSVSASAQDTVNTSVKL